MGREMSLLRMRWWFYVWVCLIKVINAFQYVAGFLPPILLHQQHHHQYPPTPPISLQVSPAGGSDDAPRYNARGVSTSKEEVMAAVAGSSSNAQGLYPCAFCKILPDVLCNDPDYALIMHADGAGSKTALAYMYWKETGDKSVWRGIAQDAIAMNVDDVFCAGATGPGVITSTIARNKQLVPAEVISALIEGFEEVVEDLRPWGIQLHVAGGETADLGDVVRTLVVDCTLTTRLKRSVVIDTSNIQAGDLIVGLSSSGQATYEKEGYNSGIGSNGLTSARHDVLSKVMASKYPETYDPSLPSSLVYSGSKTLKERIKDPAGGEVEYKVGRLLLSPTRTYAPILLPVLQAQRAHIHGLVHCSGGGQTKVLNCLRKGTPNPSRDPPSHVIKDNLFDIPLIFRLIQEESGTDWREMYQVYNMGHRMEVYVDGVQAAEEVIGIAESFGVEAKVIGRVEERRREGGSSLLTIKGPHGQFLYE